MQVDTLTAPTAPLYFPALHEMHVEASTALVEALHLPAMHAVHVSLDVTPCLPASQSVHSDAREPDERPAVHSSHTAWPLRLRLNFPLAHSEHVAEAVAAA